MRTSRHDREGGFTLLEMLVVLVILALTAGLAASRFRPHPGLVEESRLTAFLREQRGQAMLRGRSVAVFASADGTALNAPVTGGQFISAGRISPESGGRFDPRQPAVTFLFDGSASAAAIRITAPDGDTALVRVDWLTGRVSGAR